MKTSLRIPVLNEIEGMEVILPGMPVVTRCLNVFHHEGACGSGR